MTSTGRAVLLFMPFLDRRAVFDKMRGSISIHGADVSGWFGQTSNIAEPTAAVGTLLPFATIAPMSGSANLDVRISNLGVRIFRQ